MAAGNLVSTKEAAEAAGYAPDYVGYLARTGKIFAKRIGRDWFTTAEAVRAHKEGGPRVEPVPIRVEKPVEVSAKAPAVILTATAERDELERLRKEVNVLRRLLRYSQEPADRPSDPPAGEAGRPRLDSREGIQRFRPGWRRTQGAAPFLDHRASGPPKPRQYELRRAGVILFGLALFAIVSMQPALARNLTRFARDIGESFTPRTIESVREANLFSILFGSLSGLWDEIKTQLFLR